MSPVLTRVTSFLGVLLLAAGACSSPDSSDAAASGATKDRPVTTGQAPADAGSEAGWTPPAGVTLVTHERLLAFVPELPGWPTSQARGETDWPTLVSRVYADYDRGADRLELEIIDSVKNPNVMGPLLESLRGDAAAARDGLTRTTIRGFPGVAEWTAVARNGTVTVVLADRFTVKFTGSTVADLTTIRDAVAKVDLEKLAALK